MNGNLFGEDMAKRFEKKRVTRGYIYKKIGLLPDGGGEGVHEPTSNPSSDTQDECRQNVGSTLFDEPASEEPSDYLEVGENVYHVGEIQEPPYSTSCEDEKIPLNEKGIHGIHNNMVVDAAKQPVEPNEDTMYGIHSPTSPYIEPISLETFWALGKKRGYPEIPDLDLKGGMGGWNSFSLTHRIRIPDVIARLGGTS